MRRTLAYRLLMCLLILGAGLSAPDPAAAQDIAITNARVIVGNGLVVNSGTIIVRGGKIVSVSPGATNTQRLRVIAPRA